MINVSFNKRMFPDFLKVANVIPIHKRVKNRPNNYRPISLLSNISKLYGKAMHIRLTNFLRKNKVLFSYQFGFWNNYSTNRALITLTEMIRNVGNGNFACGQSWYPFQTKPLQHQGSSFWLAQKLEPLHMVYPTRLHLR